jgi:peptide/nickel transport system substrate-binding protein
MQPFKKWCWILSVAALGVVGCGDSGEAGDGSAVPSSSVAAAPTTTVQPQTGGTLRFGAYQDIAGLDPLVSLGSGTSGGIQTAAIYDTLMRYDVNTKQYTGQTAESATANADSTEWTIKIRAGIKFTDGTDYDAAAVQFGLNRHRSGVPGGPTAANCAEYVACPRNNLSSSVYMALIKDIQVVDKLTLKVTLTEPWTSFPYALAAEPSMIPSPTALKKCDGTKNPNTCEFNLKPVGAGPFMVESFKPADSINLVRNPTYWGGPTYLDGIKFVTLNDAGGMKTYESFQTGGVDVAYLRSPDAVAAAHKDNRTGFSLVEQAGEILLLNMGALLTCTGGKPEPLCVGKPDGQIPTTPNTQSLKVRQAVAAAFDPITFNQRVYSGVGTPGTDLFQNSFPWNPGVPGPKYDPEAAKRLVTEAKAQGWDGTIRVNFSNTPSGQAGGLAIEAMLKAVGMNVVLDTSKDPTATQAMVTTQKNFDAANFGTAIGPDDSAIWSLAQNLSSTSPSNRVGFKSDKVDQALKDLRVAKTDDQRKAAFRIIAEEVNALLPWITRLAQETFRVISPKVHGSVGGLKSLMYFDKAWIDTK